MLKSLSLLALLASFPLPVGAQSQPAQGQDKTVTRQNKVTMTATIRAIDQATRSVTLRADTGDEDTFTVGPEVKRFNELKVGDKITATLCAGGGGQRGKGEIDWRLPDGLNDRARPQAAASGDRIL